MRFIPVLGILVGVAVSGSAFASETIEPWPFKAAEVSLSCDKYKSVFVRTPDGQVYGVNGRAKTYAPPTDPIQAYYSTQAVIDRGLKLCEAGDGPLRLVAPVRVARPDPGPPSFELKPQERSKGHFATFEATTVIDGQRPELTFDCEPGELLGLQMDLIRPPETAPPLRGVFGTLQVDAAAPIRVELAWLPEKHWMLRGETDQDGKLQTDRVARAMLAGQKVTFKGPAGFIAQSPITWALADFGDRFDEVRKICKVSSTTDPKSSPAPASARELPAPQSISADEWRGGLLTLGLGTSDILRTNSGARTVIIGNPAIVDANVVADGVIAVTGKAAGSTNMILLDDQQTVILQTVVQVGQVGLRSRGVQVLNGDKAQDYSCSPNCIPVATASANNNGDAAASGSFRNCTAARAAGASSIRRGEKGYAPHLDADDDGIACEPPPLNKRTP